MSDAERRAIVQRVRAAASDLNAALADANAAGISGAVRLSGFTSEPQVMSLFGSGTEPSSLVVRVLLTSELRVRVEDFEYREVTKL